MDAAHGKTVGPVVVVQRVHDPRIEAQVARVGTARCVGRGRPVVAVRADIRQGSRLTRAIARGRCVKKAIAGMNATEESTSTTLRQTGMNNWRLRLAGDESAQRVMPSVDC